MRETKEKHRDTEIRAMSKIIELTCEISES